MQSGTYFGRRLLFIIGAYVFMKDFSAFLGVRHCENGTHRFEKMPNIRFIKFSPENILTFWRPVLPVLPRAQNASFLISALNSFQGVLKVLKYSSDDLILIEPHGT